MARRFPIFIFSGMAKPLSDRRSAHWKFGSPEERHRPAFVNTRACNNSLSLFFCDTKNHPVIGGTKVLSSGKSQVFDSYKLSACRMALKLSWQVALRRPSCDTGQHLCCCHCRLSESFQVFWSQPSWEFSFSSMGRRSERRTWRWEAFFNSL